MEKQITIVDEKKSIDSRKTSEAQRRARDKWNQKQAQIAIRIKPEIKTAIAEHCQKTGESVAAFIVRSCLSQIEQDESDSR